MRAFLDVSHIPDREPGHGMLADLRDGWREFVGRPWLWAIVVQFSLVNAVIVAADAVYGPQVARDHLGGAGPWGLALALFGAGNAVGALLMTRWKPRRLLLVGVLCVFPFALPSAALAVPAPVVVLCVTMFVAGMSIEVFGVSWMTAQHPHERNLFVWLTTWYSEHTGGTSKGRTGQVWPGCRPRRLRANSLLTTA
jgi:hypothetical protein